MPFHINESGDVKTCRAKPGNCRFGSDSPHFTDKEVALAHVEKNSGNSFPSGFKRNRGDITLPSGSMEDRDTGAVDERSFLFTVDGVPVSRADFRYLPGKRLWATWRENNPKLLDIEPPKGSQTQLQHMILELPEHEGFTLVSCPDEMSESAHTFREKYMENHPEVTWELDNSLEGDGGMPEATPRMTEAGVAAMLSDDGR